MNVLIHQLASTRWLFQLCLLLVFLFSASQGFCFFVDSRTYLSNPNYPGFLFMKTVPLYPYFQAGLAAFNLLLVYRIWIATPSIITLFLFAPYNLLLLSNFTKESFLFAAIALHFIIARWLWFTPILRQIGSYFALIPLLIRPAYLVLLAAGRRSTLIASGAILVTLLFFPAIFQDKLSELESRTEGREEVQHVGKDFFTYLCVEEKDSMVSFLGCVVPVFFAIPVHSDLFSFNYFVFLSFQVPVIIILWRLASVSRIDFYILIAVALTLYVILFIASPSFGAFTRYYHPVVWYCGFYYYANVSTKYSFLT